MSDKEWCKEHHCVEIDARFCGQCVAEKEIKSLKAMIVECRPWIGSDSIREYDKQKQWLTKTENIRVGE